MRLWKRLAAAALLLVLVCAALPPARAGGTVQEVRVLLRRLRLTDRADLTLEGRYAAACDGTDVAFPAGTRLTVQIRDGEMYLFAAGLAIRAGKDVRLTRYESGAQTGIRFSDGGNLYPGDLWLSVSGGQLQPVLTVPVEDYLLGVVPYEMSDDFPLEALKAQAVCARTYALARVDPSRKWDLVDTTDDQVFMGVDPRKNRAAQAVRETNGVVGMYRGKLATCYYSASNGGQTELVGNVWGGTGDWGYYRMVDDPYDLENPESIVRRARLRRDGSGLSDAFRAVLLERLAPEMAALGWETTADCLRVDSITAVSLGGRKYAEPSRFRTELTLTLTWSGRRRITPLAELPGDGEEDLLLFTTPTPSPDPFAPPTPTPEYVLSGWMAADEPVTLTLPLFPDAVQALGLNISGSGNEMITLTEESGAWLLESRRYGHGVGMSQRGAQWMAGRYGKRFDEILAFYYPGMELMIGGTDPASLPTPPERLFATPGPSASPTPRPTLMPVTGTAPPGGWLASVEGIEDDSSLNLRAEPTHAGEILMRLYKHQRLMVLETCEDPAWVHVRTDSAEGYVMVSFLERVE